MTTAVNPGSFDPVTYGHIGAIADVAAVFDKVVVAIGVNPAKNYMFSLAEREALMEQALSRIPNAEVTSFSGLLVNFMTRNQYDVIVRGIRNGQDLDESLTMETVGWQQLLAENIKVMYVPTRPENTTTSSTMLKGVLKEQGDARALAPPSTIHATQARMMGQYFYGVTGVSGSGKSTLCRAFQAVAEKRNIPLIHIDMDKIGHAILSSEKEPVYQKVRGDIVDAFGKQILDDAGQIDRKKLGAVVFSDPEKLKQLNKILHPAILFRVNDMLYGKKGVFLIDAALLAESALESIVNNQVMLVQVDADTAKQRIIARDHLQESQADRRALSQWTQQQKQDALQKSIDDAGYGNLDTVQSDPGLSDEKVERAFDKILQSVDIFGELRIGGFLKTLGVDSAGDAYTAVRKLYSGDDRFCHTLARVVDGLNALPEIVPMLQDKNAFTLAWIFQAAVMETPGTPSPAKSAEMLEKMASSWRIDRAVIAGAKDLLMAAPLAAGVDSDAALFHDFSRRIFGDTQKKLAAYQKDLTREFNKVSGDDGDAKSRQTLNDALQAGYKSAFYQEKLGARAQKNIRAALG